MSALPAPIPPELALSEPDPDLEDALDRLAVVAVETADEAGMDPDAVAVAVTAGEAPELLPPTLRGWRIDHPAVAEWAMRHVAAEDAALADLADQRDVWADKIGRWFTSAAGPHQVRRAFLAAHLERYALDVRDADPRQKSVSVPSGRVTTRSSGPTVQLVNPDAAVAWARDWLPDVIQTTERVLVSDLRDHVRIVDVIDLARITFSDAEVVLWVREGRPVAAEIEPFEARTITGPACPGVGDGWPNPDDATVLVGQVEVLASHPEVWTEDDVPVPFTVAIVAAPTVTASIKVVP